MTPRQSELLRYLIVTLDRTGVSPSYAELAEALALKSKSGVVRLVDEMVARGLLRREAPRGHNRVLAVTPAGHAAVGGSFLHNVSTGGLIAEIERRGFAVVDPKTLKVQR